MNGELCSKCKTAESLKSHRYCYTCMRLASGRPAVPKFRRDSNNKELCCKCKVEPRQGHHRYCVACRRAYNREWVEKRGGHIASLTPNQRRKMTARRYAYNLMRRGKLKKEPCKVCGDPNVEMHHLDYEPKTVNIEWLCPVHHVEATREGRKQEPEPAKDWTPDPRKAPPLERLAANSTVSADNCFLWEGYCEQGHGRIGVKGKLYWVHRLAWELLRGPIPEGKWVLHKCIGHGNCWNPEHLYLGDAITNTQDRMDQGRDADRSGELNGRARLTIEQIKWIREHHQPQSRNGLNIGRIAKMFGVSWSAIQAVTSGKSWHGVDTPPPVV